jgi:hypothetical protein
MVIYEIGINRSLIDSWVRNDQSSQQLHRVSITRMLELKLLTHAASSSSTSLPNTISGAMSR